MSAVPDVYDVVLFYKYTAIAAPEAVIAFLQEHFGPSGLNLTGRVLVAPEGINGTLGGIHSVDAEGRDPIDRFIATFVPCGLADFTGIDFKRSQAECAPFPTLLLKNVPVRRCLARWCGRAVRCLPSLPSRVCVLLCVCVVVPAAVLPCMCIALPPCLLPSGGHLHRGHNPSAPARQRHGGGCASVSRRLPCRRRLLPSRVHRAHRCSLL